MLIFTCNPSESIIIDEEIKASILSKNSSDQINVGCN